MCTGRSERVSPSEGRFPVDAIEENHGRSSKKVRAVEASARLPAEGQALPSTQGPVPQQDGSGGPSDHSLLTDRQVILQPVPHKLHKAHSLSWDVANFAVLFDAWL